MSGDYITTREMQQLWPEWITTPSKARVLAHRAGWRRRRLTYQGETEYALADVLATRHGYVADTSRMCNDRGVVVRGVSG